MSNVVAIQLPWTDKLGSQHMRARAPRLTSSSTSTLPTSLSLPSPCICRDESKRSESNSSRFSRHNLRVVTKWAEKIVFFFTINIIIIVRAQSLGRHRPLYRRHHHQEGNFWKGPWEGTWNSAFKHFVFVFKWTISVMSQRAFQHIVLYTYSILVSSSLSLYLLW